MISVIPEPIGTPAHTARPHPYKKASPMARIDFSQLTGPAHLFEQEAHLAVWHIRNKRVTHTIVAITNCAKRLVDLIRFGQTNVQFVKALRNAFEYGYDARGGGMRFDVHDDNTISIHGSFKVDELRRFLMVIPSAKTIETEHVDG